jgi:diguanylate cyclase (GGDEF)-like protein
MNTRFRRTGDLTHQTTISHRRVLIADDDASVRQLLEVTLRSDGFDVISASNGHELVRLAQERAPSLILVDLVMPQMDGYEAIRQMRNDTRTAHIPMLILTARSHTGDIVVGFETGADDYIAKPFDVNELLARVRSHLRRAAQRPVLNPLTGAPGSVLFSQELRHRLNSKQKIGLLYTDLDHFKAFNDAYGFARGDRAILLVARLIQFVLRRYGNPEDFVGHIGGDDFAILTTPDKVDLLAQHLIDLFDREVLQLYQAEDRQRGYLTAADRHGILRRFGLMTISIGVVTNERRHFVDEDEISRTAAEMKHFAKTQPRSSYAVDQRVLQQTIPNDRRVAWNKGILLVSDDSSLRSVLRRTLLEEQLSVQEASDVATLRHRLTHDEPALVLVDAHLGQELWTLIQERNGGRFNPPFIVIAYGEEELHQAQLANVAICLQQPLPLADIVACVKQLLKNHQLQETSSEVIPILGLDSPV